MSKKMIGINFQVPDNVYYGLKKITNMDNKTLNRLFGACAINRLIEKGLLNEFGEPINLPSLSLDFTNLDFSNTTNGVFNGIK